MALCLPQHNLLIMATPQKIDSQISDQASFWFARLQADDVGEEERRRFQDWFHADPQHAEAYERTQKLWMLLEMPAERVHARVSAELSTPEPVRPPLALSKKNRASGGMRHAYPIFAGLGLLMVIAVWQMPPLIQNRQSDYYTEPGEQVSVNLEDGSRLTLNTDTALKLHFSPEERRIELLRGEAYFEVAANKARPFIVHGGRAHARAVGTAYSVGKFGDDLRLAVSEGTVEFSAGAESAPVGAGQQADYRQGRIGAVLKLDGDDMFAWRRGQLVFNHQPLAQVLAELNRYRRGRIVVLNAALAERVVSGVFNCRDAGAVLEALKATMHAQAIDLPGGLILLY